MISVLIADDEYLLRSLIKNSVPWQQVRMQIVAEAGDGEKAWEHIASLKPQIALIDINMPFINGLELTKKIQESKLDTKVIILTGYKDFEFAKEAVTYHAFDYLLKPVDFEELISVLKKARKEIVHKRRAQNYLLKAKREMNKNIQFYKEELLSRLTYGRLNISNGQMVQEMKKMGIALAEDHICVIALQIEQYDDLGEDKGPFIFALLNIAQELLEKRGGFKNIEVFSEVDNYALILLNADTTDDQTAETLKWCCQEIIDTYHNYFHFTVSAGIGNSYNGYSHIHCSLIDAINALEERFYDTNDQVFLKKTYPSSREVDSIKDFLKHDDVYWNVNYVKMKDALETVKSLFEQLRERHFVEGQVKMLATSLIAVLYLITSRKRVSYDELEALDDHVFSRISRSENFDEVEQIVLDLYKKYLQNMEKKLSTKTMSEIVMKAKAFIDQNFDSPDISLNKIADAAFSNATYISSLFKKELDINISDYVSVCRMKKAVELLHDDKEISIYEISKKVGYSDPYYFSKCFKKFYGVTPSKFLANGFE